MSKNAHRSQRSRKGLNRGGMIQRVHQKEGSVIPVQGAKPMETCWGLQNALHAISKLSASTPGRLYSDDDGCDFHVALPIGLRTQSLWSFLGAFPKKHHVIGSETHITSCIQDRLGASMLVRKRVGQLPRTEPREPQPRFRSWLINCKRQHASASARWLARQRSHASKLDVCHTVPTTDRKAAWTVQDLEALRQSCQEGGFRKTYCNAHATFA